MFDLLLKGGLVVDGSGAAARAVDVGVRGGRIEALAPGLDAPAIRTIELEGQIVAPGFIDIHRHADAALFRADFGAAELRQGITSIVNGNCGMSIAPLPAARREEILAFLAPVTGSLPEEIRFGGFSDYAGLLERRPLPLNVSELAGSGTIRAAAAGYGAGELGREEIKNIQSSLEDALSAGAAGISLGMSYLPDMGYTPHTLREALAPAAGGGLPLAVHVRGEGDLLYESAAEAAEMAEILDMPLRISHFKCIGRRNWGRLLKKTIGFIEQKRGEGMIIDCDVYPWTAGSTQMLCLLPPEFLSGGTEAAVRRLRDSGERERCKDLMSRPGRDFENIVYGMGWENIYVSGLSSPKNRPLLGRTVAAIAGDGAKDPFDVFFDLMVDENCNVTMVDYITCQDDIDTILRLPYASVISDAIYPGKGRPHPRNYSNISMVFHDLVMKRHVLSIEEAVHKLTGLPAAAMGFSRKGFVRPGYDADLVVFRPEGISAPAGYTEPEKFTSGFDYVFIGGKPALEKDKITGIMAGTYLKRG
jgi:N-acyl-D-aspartate/D-glutamate deacylase